MIHDEEPIDAGAAFERLRAGNEAFARADHNVRTVSPEVRHTLVEHGQHPFAAVLTCADSRVVPEDVFMCGLGELFVVRVAGNVAGDTQVASMAYAVEHLGPRLVVVMGHTHCGAVGAVVGGDVDASIAAVCDPIVRAIGAERDEAAATVLNVRAQVARLHEALAHYVDEHDLRVVGALYHTGSGLVEWLD